MIGRRVVALVAILGIAFVVLVGGGTAVYYAQARLLDTVIAGATLLVWAVVAIARPTSRPDSALAPALGGACVAAVVSALVSGHTRIGLEYAAYIAVLSALYLLLVAMLRDPIVRARIFATLPILVLVLSVAYVAVVSIDWVAWWEALGRIATPPLRPRIEGLTYANPSTVMAMVILLLASTYAAVGTTGRRGLVLAALTGLALVASFLSGSRGGLIGLGVAVIVTSSVAAVADRPLIAARLRAFRHLRSTLAAVALVAIGLGAGFGPSILARATEGGGGELRLSFAMAAVRGFLESPLTGIGPGMWTVDRLRLSVPTDGDRYIPHAHNIELQALSEFGLVGVVVIVLGAVIAGRLIRSTFAGRSAERRRWGYASIFCLAYLVGHQQVDLFANAPAVIFAGAVPIAVLDATAPSDKGAIRRLIGVLVLGAALAATPLLAILDLTARTYELAVREADRAAWSSALPDLRLVAKADPDLGVHQLALGVAESRDGNLAAASAAFERAAALDDFPVSWINLAAVQLANGDRRAAVDSIDAAYRFGRQHPMVAFAVAQLRVQVGDHAGAIEALGRTLVLAPTLAGDPAWGDQHELESLLEPALQHARAELDPEGRLVLALSLGAEAEALTVADTMDGSLARLMIEATFDPREKLAPLVQYADQYPGSALAASWAMHVARGLGDAATVDRLQRRENALNTYASTLALDVRMTGRVTRTTLLVNQSNVLHGTYTYRRPTPQDYLVPWLLRLEWR